MLAKLENMEGIERIHAVTGVPITLPYKQDGFTGMWLEGYLSNKPYLSYEEAEADYRKHPEHYYGMLKGIDDAEFDYLNGTLGTPVDRQIFWRGESAFSSMEGLRSRRSTRRERLSILTIRTKITGSLSELSTMTDITFLRQWGPV